MSLTEDVFALISGKYHFSFFFLDDDRGNTHSGKYTNSTNCFFTNCIVFEIMRLFYSHSLKY